MAVAIPNYARQPGFIALAAVAVIGWVLAIWSISVNSAQETEFTAQIQELEQSRAAAVAQLDELRQAAGRLEGINNQLETARADLEYLRNQQQEAGDALARLRSQLEPAEQRSAELRRQITTETERLNQLLGETSAVTQQLEQARQDIAAAERNLATTRSNLAEIERRRTETAQELERMTADRNRAMAELRQMRDASMHLQRQSGGTGGGANAIEQRIGPLQPVVPSGEGLAGTGSLGARPLPSSIAEQGADQQVYRCAETPTGWECASGTSRNGSGTDGIPRVRPVR